MRGVDEEDVTVNVQAGTATVRLDGPEMPTTDELVAAFEGTRFTAKPRD